ERLPPVASSMARAAARWMSASGAGNGSGPPARPGAGREPKGPSVNCPGGEQHGALDGIAQLPNVSGPLVGEQRAADLWGEGGLGDLVVGREAREEEL